MRLFVTLCMLVIASSLFAQQSSKEQAVNDFREYFSKNAYRGHQLTKGKLEQFTAAHCIELLGSNGKFIDLIDEQEAIEHEKMNLARSTKPQHIVNNLLEKAFNRMWRIARIYRGKKYSEYKEDQTFLKLCKAIENYSKIEVARGSITNGRFHESCFAIPTAAVNTYFCLFDAMEQIEKGLDKRKLMLQVNKSLVQMSYQSWTQPYREDDTDKNVVSVERFRKHVWWVGGNGLGFRSLLPTAAAMHSVEMMDVLAVVAKGGLSSVSQNTYDDAFWTEGFTADGAGWGHGMQCLIWGYPISGTSAALNLIEYFKGTPWAKDLDHENAAALLNYYRGSSWFYYKGYIPCCLGRGSMAFKELAEEKIKTKEMLDITVSSWLSSYSQAEQKELLDLQKDIKDNQISMEAYQEGDYTGTRWFFNNDNLIKKNPNYYQFVSMASNRCDGIEMAHFMADRYNFFTCDGMTYFMKNGNEYHKAIGAWNLTAIPGVTSRQGEEKLIPITNWRGYCSKHNFAGATTSGGDNAACGFIFEKMNGSDKKDVNDKTGSKDPNTIIYGVKAHKAYFMVDDYLLALGTGIENLNPEMEGDIWTTIDQTHYNNKIAYFSNGKRFEAKGSNFIQLKDKQLVWASQKDGFAYAVLPGLTTGDVFLATETRKTKWEELNETNKKIKDLPQTEDIFQLHINHGRKVKNGTYAYVVYAGEDKPSKAFKSLPLNVLENSIDIQAISWGDNYIGAIFYNPEKEIETSKGNIMVSAPCALLLEKSKEIWKLSLTDARMDKDLKFIELKTTLPIKGKNISSDGMWNVFKVQMPQGKDCGKPITINLVSSK